MIHKIAQKHTVERPTGECDASGHSTTRTLIKRAEAGPKQAKHPTLGEASQVEERGWARPPFFNVAVLHMSSSATSLIGIRTGVVIAYSGATSSSPSGEPTHDSRVQRHA